jgi:hypothetical protein
MELKVVSRALFELRFDKSYREYPAEINYFRWLLRMSVKDLRQLALFSGGEIGDCSDFIGSSAPTSPKDFDSSAPLGSPDDRGELRRHSWERI